MEEEIDHTKGPYIKDFWNNLACLFVIVIPAAIGG